MNRMNENRTEPGNRFQVIASHIHLILWRITPIIPSSTVCYQKITWSKDKMTSHGLSGQGRFLRGAPYVSS